MKSQRINICAGAPRPNLIVFFIMISLIQFCFVACLNEPKEQIVLESNYKLVWSDEFDYTGLPDSTKWSYIVGDGCPELCGWGNNELQYYTEKRLKNARVVDGILTIEVHKEKMGNCNFSSAKLTTKEKSDWKYGRFEIRAKIPTHQGINSVIQMIPVVGSNSDGPHQISEINILGLLPDNMDTSKHNEVNYLAKGGQNPATNQFPLRANNFHTYILEWEETEYRVYADSIHYFTFPNNREGKMTWGFNQPFYLILNVANRGNQELTEELYSDELPQKMEVDYVRVYQIET